MFAEAAEPAAAVPSEADRIGRLSRLQPQPVFRRVSLARFGLVVSRFAMLKLSFLGRFLDILRLRNPTLQLMEPTVETMRLVGVSRKKDRILPCFVRWCETRGVRWSSGRLVGVEDGTVSP